MSDLAPDLAQARMDDIAIDRLIGRVCFNVACLEAAAADESASPEVRARLTAMVHLVRTATDTAGRLRNDPEGADRA